MGKTTTTTKNKKTKKTHNQLAFQEIKDIKFESRKSLRK